MKIWIEYNTKKEITVAETTTLSEVAATARIEFKLNSSEMSLYVQESQDSINNGDDRFNDSLKKLRIFDGDHIVISGVKDGSSFSFF